MTKTLVFVGDSITDAGHRDDPQGFGSGYVRQLVGTLSQEYARVVNAGTSGDRVRDLRRRWAEDVMICSPDALSVYVGVNDTWRRFDSGEETTAAQFEADYRALLDDARSGGVRHLVLVEPFLLPVSLEQQRWVEDLEHKQQIVRRLADEYGATFVALQHPLSLTAGERPESIAPDGVHPNAEGSALIAELWLAAVG